MVKVRFINSGSHTSASNFHPQQAIRRRFRLEFRGFPAAILGVQGLINLCLGPKTQLEEGDREMTKLTDYVKTAEAAEILGVAQNTIRKWAARGDIPMHRNPANGYRLFKRSDLEKFLRKAAKPVNTKK